MIGFLLVLYPERWRRRYGEEFQAVLESRPLGPFDVADVLLGALDARLTPFRLAGMAETGGHLMLLRLGGYGAIVGGPLWFAGLAIASGSGGMGTTAGGGLMLLGTFGLILALIGLSAFQAHRAPRLAWAALLIPGAGAILSMVGIVGLATNPDGGPTALAGLSGWDAWIVGLLATFVGSILFGVVTYRTGVLSARAGAALAWSSTAVIALSAFSSGFVDGQPNPLLIAAVMAAFAGSWVALGVSALRRGPIRAVSPA